MMNQHWPLNQLAAELPESLSIPAAMVNVTNRCTLKCEHCFIYRDANPNEPVDEPSDDELYHQLDALSEKHGIHHMLWMGGEPMVRRKFLRRGVTLFASNTITTNGTLVLEDYSDVTDNLLYVISLDGPEEQNDAIRGKGVFQNVRKKLAKLPAEFPHNIQCQCVVTKRNQNVLSEFLEVIADMPFHHMTFSFHVPGREDFGGDAWDSVEERDEAVRTVMRLKEASNGFVRNRKRSLEMMLSENNPKRVTDDCLSPKYVLPLYLDGKNLVTPMCCMGNDADCDRCGSWVVFDLAARREVVNA